jgi:hypothetical protein
MESSPVRIARKIIRFWVPVVLWAAVIFTFSTWQTHKSAEFSIVDFVIKKSAHIIEYGIFAALIFRALKNGGVNKAEAAVYAVILAMMYGISDEIHQSFTPGREPRVRDVFFDTFGSILATYIILKFLPKSSEKVKKIAQDFQLI